MIKVNNKILIKGKKNLSKLQQIRGLMFFIKMPNKAFIFDRGYESILNSSIHMWFVFFPINVIFLNSNKKIVDIKQNLKPFSYYSPKKKARYIIELPKQINLSKIKKGDLVSW